MKNQRGAVLIVSLVLLLLITMVAVTTISSSTFQTVMVNNAQQREFAFRAAESATEQALDADATLAPAYNTYLRWKGSGNPDDRYFTVPSASLSTPMHGVDGLAATVYYMGAGPQPIGESIREGSGIKKQNAIYEVRGFAKSSDDKLQSQIIQGVSRLTSIACGTYDPC
jgi:type II secretory pathway pseudopilin PulG